MIVQRAILKKNEWGILSFNNREATDALYTHHSDILVAHFGSSHLPAGV
jgi:hypothetical protein